MIQKIIPNRGNIGRMVKNKTIENQHFIFWTGIYPRSLLLTLTLNLKSPKNPSNEALKNMCPGENSPKKNKSF